MLRALPFALVLAALSALVGCAGSAPAASASGEGGGGYGLSPETAVRVGEAGAEGSGGPSRERAYLDRLRGPSGAPLSYERASSCCSFPTENSPLGVGLLDVYEVWGAGLDGRLTLYLNMYDPPRDGEADRAPPGLTIVPTGAP